MKGVGVEAFRDGEKLVPFRTVDRGEKRDLKEFPFRFKSVFDVEIGLALLLLNGVVEMGEGLECRVSGIFEKGRLHVERVPVKEVHRLYGMWIKDEDWGPAVWCCMRRGEKPRHEVAEKIRKGGKWDLGAMGLRPNAYDLVVKEWVEGDEGDEGDERDG